MTRTMLAVNLGWPLGLSHDGDPFEVEDPPEPAELLLELVTRLATGAAGRRPS